MIRLGKHLFHVEQSFHKVCAMFHVEQMHHFAALHFLGHSSTFHEDRALVRFI